MDDADRIGQIDYLPLGKVREYGGGQTVEPGGRFEWAGQTWACLAISRNYVHARPLPER